MRALLCGVAEVDERVGEIVPVVVIALSSLSACP
jgi:hypothetical protein